MGGGAGGGAGGAGGLPLPPIGLSAGLLTVKAGEDAFFSSHPTLQASTATVSNRNSHFVTDHLGDQLETNDRSGVAPSRQPVR